MTETESSKTQNRYLNMDILRILLTVMVIVLHINNRDMGGALNYTGYGTGYEIFIRFFESLAICAVDSFLMLSGYFARTDDKMIPWRKALFLLLTCSFYRVTGYLCQIIFMTPGQFNIKTFIGYMIPNNWYVCLFVTLLLLTPYTGRVLGSLDDKELCGLNFVLIVLFGAVPMFVNSLTGYNMQGLATVTWQGDGMGFNIGVFFTCYVTGYSIRRFHDYWDRFGALFYLLMFVLTATLNAAISHFSETIWYYSSLTVILEASMLVLAFTRFGTGKREHKVIPALVGCSLGVFLWHIMPVMYVGFWVRFDLSSKAKAGFMSFAAWTALAVLAMYAVCVVWVLACRMAISFFKRLKHSR